MNNSSGPQLWLEDVQNWKALWNESQLELEFRNENEIENSIRNKCAETVHQIDDIVLRDWIESFISEEELHATWNQFRIFLEQEKVAAYIRTIMSNELKMTFRRKFEDIRLLTVAKAWEIWVDEIHIRTQVTRLHLLNNIGMEKFLENFLKQKNVADAFKDFCFRANALDKRLFVFDLYKDLESINSLWNGENVISRMSYALRTGPWLSEATTIWQWLDRLIRGDSYRPTQFHNLMAKALWKVYWILSEEEIQWLRWVGS